MSKFYEANIKMFKTVVVEVPDDWDEDQAADFINAECIGSADAEYVVNLLDEKDVEQATRLADEYILM